jgi:hypothetical protein
MTEFIIGSVRQGAGTNKLWRPGDQINARKVCTMFFTGVCPSINEIPGVLNQLKSVSGFVVSIDAVGFVSDDVRFAELSLEDPGKLYKEILSDCLFSDRLEDMYIQTPPVMTLPNGCSVGVGDRFNVGYLSILSPVDVGVYELVHDYPLQRSQGPRFEISLLEGLE